MPASNSKASTHQLTPDRGLEPVCRTAALYRISTDPGHLALGERLAVKGLSEPKGRSSIAAVHRLLKHKASLCDFALPEEIFGAPKKASFVIPGSTWPCRTWDAGRPVH